MKMFKLWSAAAVAALVLLTSCLGDSGSTSQELYSVGIVRTSEKTLLPIVRTAVGDVYNEQMTSMGFYPGDCVLLHFVYDSSNPKNADDVKNEYVYVSLASTPVQINRWHVYGQTDTTKLMDKEFVLTKSVAAFTSPYFAMNLDGYFFITPTFKALTDQKNNWYLSFDANQEPVDVQGKKVYSLFLRGTVRTEGKTPVVDQYDTNAFDISAVISQLTAKEKAAGNKSFALRVNYLEKINEKDSTDLTWASSDIMNYQFEE